MKPRLTLVLLPERINAINSGACEIFPGNGRLTVVYVVLQSWAESVERPWPKP